MQIFAFNPFIYVIPKHPAGHSTITRIPMLNSNQLREGLRNHDSKKITLAFGICNCGDEEIARKFVTLIKQSSCLTIQIKDAAQEKRRDELIQFCRELLKTCPNPKIIQDFEHHVADAAIVEFGYREIFDLLKISEISKHTPAKQAWGMIRRAQDEFDYIKRQIAEAIRKHRTEKGTVFDPQQLTITSEEGTRVRPDALTHAITKNVGDTLITLGYIHKWFEKGSGVIIIPPEETVDDSISFQAGVFTLAACQWRRLEDAWDRSRFFGARFRREGKVIPFNDGVERNANFIVLSPATEIELLDRIATQRLTQAYFQRQMDFYPNDDKKASPGNEPLNATSYISTAEEIACGMLRDSYHLPIDDENVKVEGLSVRALLRGYAYYEKIARSPSGESILSCIRFSEAELLKGLCSVGLSNEQATKFIYLTTFGRKVSDLFDAPLIKVRDGSYCFFSAAFHAPVLSAIALSRIACINRQRDDAGELVNDNVFEDKGRRFESRTKGLLTRHGIQTHGFKYTINGVEYDCDAAALVEETLYIFECKNRSLPMGHLPSLYYFSLTLKEAENQVRRIAKQLGDNPHILQQHFGPSAKWKRIVPVVLNALPWSSGLSNGVYTYDASALVHFLEVGAINLIFVHKDGDDTQKNGLKYPLRHESTPTAQELEEQLSYPVQLKLNLLGREQVSKPLQATPNTVFVFPEWSQQPVTVKEQMIALGTSPKMAEKIENQMIAKKKGAQGGMGAATEDKAGRNDPCPCGSGKKYKKCCLT